MVERSAAINLKIIGNELIKKAIITNKVTPSARDIKDMIEKITE